MSEPPPPLCGPAGLIADRTRATFLVALDRSGTLSVTELASAAGVSLSTASEHLVRLLGGGLVQVEARGRVRFYRLAGPEVSKALQALESLAGEERGSDRPRTPAERPEALARTCYDHLAGRLGTSLLDVLIRERHLTHHGVGEYRVTLSGARFLRDFGLDLHQLSTHRRPSATPCLDRTERRPHLAGHVGAQLARRCLHLRWIERTGEGRALAITRKGRAGFRARFGIEL